MPIANDKVPLGENGTVRCRPILLLGIHGVYMLPLQIHLLAVRQNQQSSHMFVVPSMIKLILFFVCTRFYRSGCCLPPSAELSGQEALAVVSSTWRVNFAKVGSEFEIYVLPANGGYVVRYEKSGSLLESIVEPTFNKGREAPLGSISAAIDDQGVGRAVRVAIGTLYGSGGLNTPVYVQIRQRPEGYGVLIARIPRISGGYKLIVVSKDFALVRIYGGA